VPQRHGFPTYRYWVVLTLFLIVPARVLCQIQNGQFNGVIEDPSGANVPNAWVLIVGRPSDNNRVPSPLFGKAGGTFSPRNLQFGLKLSF